VRTVGECAEEFLRPLVAANQPLPGRLGMNGESVINMASTFAHLAGMLSGVRLPQQHRRGTGI